MKKVLSVLLTLLLIFAVGCANKITPPESTKPSADKQQGQVSQPQTGSNAESAPIINEQQNTSSPSDPDGNNYIGEQKAKEIALEKAGLSENEVIFERVEFDFDDGIYQYEVEFNKGRTEYSADINATNGQIIDWEVDFDD